MCSRSDTDMVVACLFVVVDRWRCAVFNCCLLFVVVLFSVFVPHPLGLASVSKHVGMRGFLRGSKFGCLRRRFGLWFVAVYRCFP